MQSKEKKPNLIIKKYIINHPPVHHGGAWKVAYADFVTAMMAFFLLLWLINSTPSQKLKGIAQYFEPTIGLMNMRALDKDSTAIKSEDDMVTSEGSSVTGAVYGVKRAGQIISVKQQEIDLEEESQMLIVTQDNITKELANDAAMSQYKGQVKFEQLPEGLLIQIQDQDKKEMFFAGSKALTPHAKLILDKISKMIQFSPNFIAIGGYTERLSDIKGDYTGWELSADRANAARRFLIEKGIAVDRVAKVTAFADASPLNEKDPYSWKNRRISIVLLRQSVMPVYKISAPQGLKPSE